MKVLFICVGNSCRSQIAEGFGRQLGLDAESAGVKVRKSVLAIEKEPVTDR